MSTGFDPAAFRAGVAAAVRAGVATDPAERLADAMAAAFAASVAAPAVERARRAPAAHQPRTRAQAVMLLSRASRPPARVRAQSTAVGVERLDLTGEIGGEWGGITAAAFSAQLRNVTAGVVELHVNSPGGDVWDGLAIHNELRDHPAIVHVVVDGLAASAASFIAMAGDTVTMNRGSQLMIHDAWSSTHGDQADHLRSAELLGRVSDAIAGLYADRAGGTTEDWRDVMRAETWFSATEAVDAGLADTATADQADEDKPVAAQLDAGALVAALRAGVRGALS